MMCSMSQVHIPSFVSPTRIMRLLHPHDVQHRSSASYVNIPVLTSMVDGVELVLTPRAGSLPAASNRTQLNVLLTMPF